VKTKTGTKLPKNLQKALDIFPKIVAHNRTAHAKKQKFADKIFGELARKVYKEVHGKKMPK
jgi:hypothetical protein